MPYIKRSVPQALDLVDPGVIDVYSSPTVFVNYQQVALWNAPTLGNCALSQLAIPTPAPLENYAPNPAQITFYNSSRAAALASPVEVEITAGGGGGPGTIAQQAQGDPAGSNTSDPNDLAGNPDTTTPLPQAGGASGVYGALANLLEKTLKEAAAGQWREQGGAPGNPNIMNCFAKTGGIAAAARIGPGDSVAWCAAFAGTMLSGAGATGLVAWTAVSYKTQWVSKTGAISLSLNDPSTWRLHDVVVMQTPTSEGIQNHVAFLRGVDVQAGRVKLLGGNQGNGDVTEARYKAGSIRNVGFVGRQWPIPSEFDTPLKGV